MKLPLYVVDAFTSQVFRGNPAAVCPLDSWLDEELMQNIAAENNLAETAFVVRAGEGWRLRWFTPLVEVDLCGHATLATAFVLAKLDPSLHDFRFQTRSGELRVTREDDRYTLDFPVRTLTALAPSAELAAALGCEVRQLTQAAQGAIAELASEDEVKRCQPDFAALKALPWSAISITARGSDCDFVSRFFAPKVGIDEDPVTGSAHCGLMPYWVEKLGRTQLSAKQLSRRGGELLCELRGERVLMTGSAVLYSAGHIL